MINDSTRRRMDSDLIQIRISGQVDKAEIVKVRLVELLRDWLVETSDFYKNRFDVGGRCYLTVKPPEVDTR